MLDDQMKKMYKNESTKKTQQKNESTRNLIVYY